MLLFNIPLHTYYVQCSYITNVINYLPIVLVNFGMTLHFGGQIYFLCLSELSRTRWLESEVGIKDVVSCDVLRRS